MPADQPHRRGARPAGVRFFLERMPAVADLGDDSVCGVKEVGGRFPGSVDGEQEILAGAEPGQAHGSNGPRCKSIVVGGGCRRLAP